MKKRLRRRFDKKNVGTNKKKNKVKSVLEAAIILFNNGDKARAISKLEHAFSENPKQPMFGNVLGVMLHQLGKQKEACGVLKKYLELHPRDGEAWLNLGLIKCDLGMHLSAVSDFDKAGVLEPKNPVVFFNRSGAMIELQRYQEAERDLKCCLQINPRHGEAWKRLAFVNKMQNDFDSAIAAYSMATEELPNDYMLWDDFGFALSVQGDMEKAMTCYVRASKLNPKYPSVYLNIAKAGKLAKGSNLYKNAMSIALDQKLDPLSRSSVLFAIGIALDAAKSFEEAFSFFDNANQLMRSQIQYDETLELGKIDAVMSTFTDQDFSRIVASSAASESPIFIVGMPRSGTSLVEQILASHKDVYGAGERREIKEFADEVRYPESIENIPITKIESLRKRYSEKMQNLSGTKLRYTDKEPRNFMFIWLIFTLFPDARIIHCKRHPVDTCLSCYMQQFNAGVGFSFNLEELGRYYRKYLEIMDFWDKKFPDRILDVTYEALVANTKSETKRLATFCDLVWERSMLEHHKTKRSVFTASKDQVRRPIYQSSISRWRSYETHLGPLFEALGDFIF